MRRISCYNWMRATIPDQEVIATPCDCQVGLVYRVSKQSVIFGTHVQLEDNAFDKDFKRF
ncbi:MAG: hypothetical protein LBL76_00250 [Treponema sp.]|jgi:hypothetical protein|nr:hypothetical protein [Treponema sp.]